MHFLDGTELTRDQLTSLLDRALARYRLGEALLELLVSDASPKG